MALGAPPEGVRQEIRAGSLTAGPPSLSSLALRTVGGSFACQPTLGRGPRHGLTTAGVAQLAEHLICNQGVVGSTPIVGSTSPRPKRPRGGDAESTTKTRLDPPGTRSARAKGPPTLRRRAVPWKRDNLTDDTGADAPRGRRAVRARPGLRSPATERRGLRGAHGSEASALEPGTGNTCALAASSAAARDCVDAARPPRACGGRAVAPRRVLAGPWGHSQGEIPERPNGPDCKSGGSHLRRFESASPHQPPLPSTRAGAPVRFRPAVPRLLRMEQAAARARPACFGPMEGAGESCGGQWPTRA